MEKEYENIIGSSVLFGMTHVSDDDLERYHLGEVVNEIELAFLEEHLLICPECVHKAEFADDYVDALRAAIIGGRFDLE